MRIVNFWGGPGAGKSTHAAAVFAALKIMGYRVELVGEAAKDLIYEGRQHVLAENQLLISGLQYQKLLDLERAGCKVAVSDSPLMLGAYYGQLSGIGQPLSEALTSLNKSWEALDVWLNRPERYDSFGRIQQTKEEAKEIDTKLRAFVTPHLEVTAGNEAYSKVMPAVIEFIS